jgi:hypothetical protein
MPTVSLDNLTLTDIVRNKSFFATIMAGLECLQKYCDGNIAESFPDQFTDADDEAIPAPGIDEVEELMEAFNFAAGAAMDPTVITVDRGLGVISDNPSGAEIHFLDFDRFRHGECSLSIPRTQVNPRLLEWLKSNRTQWFHEQLDRESKQRKFKGKKMDALERFRCTQAVLELTAEAEYKPTALLDKLSPPFSYEMVQDALSALLETGDIVADPDMILVNRISKKN